MPEARPEDLYHREKEKRAARDAERAAEHERLMQEAEAKFKAEMEQRDKHGPSRHPMTGKKSPGLGKRTK